MGITIGRRPKCCSKCIKAVYDINKEKDILVCPKCDETNSDLKNIDAWRGKFVEITGVAPKVAWGECNVCSVITGEKDMLISCYFRKKCKTKPDTMVCDNCVMPLPGIAAVSIPVCPKCNESLNEHRGVDSPRSSNPGQQIESVKRFSFNERQRFPNTKKRLTTQPSPDNAAAK